MKVRAKVLNFKVHDVKIMGLKHDFNIHSLCWRKDAKWNFAVDLSSDNTICLGLQMASFTLLPGWL